MEPRFEVQTLFNREHVAKMCRLYAKQPKTRLMRIAYLGLAVLYVSILRPLFDPVAIEALTSGALPVLFAENPISTIIVLSAPLAILYFVYRSIFMMRQYERRLWKHNQKHDGSISVATLFDDHFVDVSRGVTFTVQYGEITAVEETEEIFFLKTARSFGFAFAKSDFTLGSPDDFRAFIEEKTGKKIKFIR